MQRPGRANDRQGAAQRAVRGGAAGRAHLIRGDGGRAGAAALWLCCARLDQLWLRALALPPLALATSRRHRYQQQNTPKGNRGWRSGRRGSSSGGCCGGGSGGCGGWHPVSSSAAARAQHSAGAAEASGRVADSSSYIYTCVHQPWSVKRVRQKQWGSHRTSGGQEGAAVFTLKCSFSGPAQHMHEGGDRLMAEGTNLDRGAPRHRSRMA